MTLSVHAMAINTFVPMLRALSNILDKGTEHAGAKKFDPDVLATARLAPDMFTLAQQVQIACDHAKNTTARLMGEEPSRVEDTERTIDQLRARIARTIDYLENARPAAFAGADDRRITMPLFDDFVLEMTGAQFLRDWALPHFYFHVVTAYDILRHNGVEIGKRDYLSHVSSAIRRRG